MTKDIRFGFILGSGLSDIIDRYDIKKVFSEDKRGIHQKKVCLLNYEEQGILSFCGRKHFYEGYSQKELWENILFAKDKGVKYLFITNAAGAINKNFEVSELMLISSHINLNNKLKFKKSNKLYNTELQDKFLNICLAHKILCHTGVYGSVSGPVYETPAEIRMLRNSGCDAVGMSTIPEIMNSSLSGINVIAVSVITNLLFENKILKTSHHNILQASNKAINSLFTSFNAMITELK